MKYERDPDLVPTLNAWDLTLLRRYLPFYLSLDNGERLPNTNAQEHFVRVCREHVGPRTQHEIAYSKYKRAIEAMCVSEPEDHGTEPMDSVVAPSLTEIRLVGAVERAALELENQRQPGGRALARIVSAYRQGTARASGFLAEAGVWVSTFLSDSGVSSTVEAWSSRTFNTVSDAYAKAMDGQFAISGIQRGDIATQPIWHRLVEGHVPFEAWSRVSDALPNDTQFQEFVGFLRAYLSDFSSTVGMPLVSTGKEHLEKLISVSKSVGISETYLNDALHLNATELLSMSVPLLAIIFGWNTANKDEFAHLVGAIGVGSVVAANPVGLLICVVCVARAYDRCVSADERSAWARAASKGGITSSLVLATSAVIGGPAWVGVVVALMLVVCVGVMRRRDFSREVKTLLLSVGELVTGRKPQTT